MLNMHLSTLAAVILCSISSASIFSGHDTTQSPIITEEDLNHNKKPTETKPFDGVLGSMASNRLCENSSKVALEADGIGFITFENGYLYARPHLTNITAPAWNITHFNSGWRIHHVNPFEQSLYLSSTIGHMSIANNDGSSRFNVRYTASTSPGNLVIGAGDACLYVDSSDTADRGKVFMRSQSACTPLRFTLANAEFGRGGQANRRLVDWTEPGTDQAACPSTLRKYIERLDKDALKKVFAEMGRSEFGEQKWPEEFEYFIQSLPMSLLGAPVCGVICSQDPSSLGCRQCTGPGGIV